MRQLFESIEEVEVLDQVLEQLDSWSQAGWQQSLNPTETTMCCYIFTLLHHPQQEMREAKIQMNAGGNMTDPTSTAQQDLPKGWKCLQTSSCSNLKGWP